MSRVFTKEHSRDYSLFRVAGWYESFTKWLPKIAGIGSEEQCAVYRGKGLVSVYYEKKTFNQTMEYAAQMAKDDKVIKAQVDQFLKIFNILYPYFIKQKEIKDKKELKKIYDLYSEYWALLAIVWLVPMLPTASQKIKDSTLKIRQKTQEYSEDIDYPFTKALEKFYPKLAGKTRFILPEEVWGNKVANYQTMSKKIAKRAKGFIYYKKRLYVGKDIDDLARKLKIILSDGEGTSDSKDILKGQSAQKGKVKGRVRLVFGVQDLANVKKGDILVAAMTMPKYLVAMKKAAAFVTDEGGITCHAAIVSREMKKPCVVGTKIATQILKDNDLVEVDANSGVVKIL